jgi:hypothetical protein
MAVKNQVVDFLVTTTFFFVCLHVADISEEPAASLEAEVPLKCGHNPEVHNNRY